MKLPCNLFNNSDAKQGRLTCGGAISIRKNSYMEISKYHGDFDFQRVFLIVCSKFHLTVIEMCEITG